MKMTLPPMATLAGDAPHHRLPPSPGATLSFYAAIGRHRPSFLRDAHSNLAAVAVSFFQDDGAGHGYSRPRSVSPALLIRSQRQMPRASTLGFSRIVVSEIEAPIIFVNPVWSG
jgi:hypothetical protein